MCNKYLNMTACLHQQSLLSCVTCTYCTCVFSVGHSLLWSFVQPSYTQSDLPGVGTCCIAHLYYSSLSQVKQLCERSAFYSSGNFWLTIFPGGCTFRAVCSLGSCLLYGVLVATARVACSLRCGLLGLGLSAHQRIVCFLGCGFPLVLGLSAL